MGINVTDGLIIGSVGLIGGLWARLLANSVGVEMPWFAQFGICGLLGFLTWWGMERGDRRTGKAMDDLRSEIGGMRSDLKSGQETTNELLSKALFPNRNP